MANNTKKNSNQPSALSLRWERFCAFWHSDRTRIICGILLATVTLLLMICCVSFFFTGKADYSLIRMSSEERVLERTNIHNALGLPGAWIASALIDGAFGWMIFVILWMMAVESARILHAFRFPQLRWISCSLFWLIWGSITLSFIQIACDIDSFHRFGGAFGHWIAEIGNSYIQVLGMSILLIVSLLVFIVIADRNFVEHCIMLRDRLRKTPSQDTPEEPEQTDHQEAQSDNSFTLTVEDAEPTKPVDQTEQPTIDVTIVQPETPEYPAEPEQPEQTEQTEQAGMPQTDGLTIEAGEATEINDEDPEYILKTQGPYDPRKDLENYQFPSLSLLKVYDNETQPVINQEEQQANANRIVTTLRNYGVEIESIKATVGPTVTLYEVVPKAGTRVSTIQRLENDIMLALSAEGIRIIAPMPGKGTVGIEVPNEKPQVVSMHSVIASKRFTEEQKMRLPIAIGKTITNEIFMFDLAKTPHLLVAGATGQGKSVGLNAIISSLLYKKHPAELKFVLVDPKMVEFTIYKPLLKHYMAAMPDQDDDDIIITDCQKVINTLNSLVIEMEDRYSLLAAANCRNVEDYNEKFVQRRLSPAKDIENKVTKKILHHHYMPYLVIVIDEYGDFIMQAGKEVETPIARITQKARAVGMHMILATQRPSVNIVTGVIKANIPTRIAFRTQSVIDSRTVLDATGANQLIGKGDMLYSAGGNMTRIQCAFVDTPEVEKIVDHIHGQQHYSAPYQLPEYVGEGGDGEALAPGSVDLKHLDPMFGDIARYVVSKQEGSTSKLQRAFEIGYNRAGKLSDQLEAAGIVGPNRGPKGRDVLIQDMESLESILQQLNVR